MTTTHPFPLLSARANAEAIVNILAPHCEKIHIAGSIRREKPEVGDIEIVCQPHTVASDFFGNENVRHPFFVHQARALGQILKGNIETGNMVQIETRSIDAATFNQPITLDLFIPKPPDYFRQLAIRTGSADYSWKVIAGGWLRKGWCGTINAGLRRQSDCCLKDGKWQCLNLHGELPPVWTSEQDFFTWLGVPYIEPKKRVI